MDIKELRIGNFVKYRWAIIKVDSIYRCGINLKSVYNKYACQDQVTGRVKIKDVKPIPLTEEWLLKCGFIKGNDMFFLPVPMLDMEIHAVFFHGQYVIELHNHVKAIITEVKHVHQLQNLHFSLTGQELTIK